MKPDCIFCRIAAGDLPAARVFEDKHTLAFLDIGPLVKGHTLVIPKVHYDPLIETPLEVLAACISTVQRVARALADALGADGVNVHQANGAAAGQVVPHLHFHVIPRFCGDGHHWNWHPGNYAHPEEMAAMGAKISIAAAGQR